MNESHISKRYAKAVLSYARDLGEDKAIYERMRILTHNCRAMPRLIQTLSSPVVPRDKKKSLILEAGGKGNQKSYEAFSRIVVDNHRENLLCNIAMAYIKLYRGVHNISVINLTSANPLPESVQERIRNNITSRTHGTAEIEIRIDESIDGGFILQVDDMRLDASVKGQLDRIRRQLTNTEKKLV